MSHCYSIGIQVNGEEQEICSLVPGNEDLAKRVREAEQKGGPGPKISEEETQRAVDYFKKTGQKHEHTEPKKKGKTIMTR